MFLMKELIALLKNGHSGYNDHVISQLTGYLDFEFGLYGEKWLVTRTFNKMLLKGTEITHINDIPINDFYTKHKKYISASSEYERRSKFGANANYHVIYEKDFSVSIDNGKKVQVKKISNNLFNDYDQMEVEGKWINNGKIGYIKIPSFSKQKFESKALEYVQEFLNAKVIIIDLRNNGGGSTPINLINLLMNVPYRWWSESTAMSFGLFNFYASQKRLKKKTQSKSSDSTENELEEIFEMLDNSNFFTMSPFEEPKDSCYTGEVIVLVNRYTNSAAEDFCMPLKIFRNATLIGERTMGSTGQPYYIKFPFDIDMYVSTKRTYFPNGNIFEGKGIEPNINIDLAVEDIKLDKDIVLKKTILIAKKNLENN